MLLDDLRSVVPAMDTGAWVSSYARFIRLLSHSPMMKLWPSRFIS